MGCPSSMKARVCVWVVSAVLIGALPTSSASAQTPLAHVLPTLLGDGLRLAPGPGGSHADDFIYPADLAATVGPFFAPPVNIFNEFVTEQLRTFPATTSSGGFLFSFDPVLGTFARTTRSFGPTYAERPLTSGRRTLSVGVSLQNLVFDRISGVPLDSNDVRLYFSHRDSSSGFSLSPERSDLIEATVRLNVRSNTLSTMVTYGLTDRLDVGVIVPFVDVTLEAQVDKRIIRLGTAADPTIHSFDGRGGDTKSDRDGGTRSGIGDIRITGKYNVLRRRSFAMAAAWDVRLPTGDADNLLGAGNVFTRASAIVSAGSHSFSPHASITATLVPSSGLESGFHEQGAELTYNGGVDWSVVPRVTVNADLLIRSSFGDFGFQDDVRPADTPHSYVTTTQPGRTQTTTLRGFSWTDEGPALMHAAIGAKVAVWRTMLAIGSVVIAMTDTRLHNKPAATFGLEYTF